MLKHKSWTNKHTRLVQLVTIVGLFGVAALGTYTIHSSHAAVFDMGTDSTCVFSVTTTPAFCDSFSTPANGGTQTGDLDPVLWGVSRAGSFNQGQQHYNGITPSHNACSGGGTTGDPINGDPNSVPFGPVTAPPADARICNGMYVESNNDGGSVTAMDTYPKQPFDFAGRTGRVVFDVSLDSQNGHDAWPEFVITDEPVPGTLRCISICPTTTFATNEVGFSMAGGTPILSAGKAGVDTIFVSKNGIYANVAFTDYGDIIAPGSITLGNGTVASAKMNHFEIQISPPGVVDNTGLTRIDIYGTDAGSTTLKHLVGTNVDINFTRGLVWINDVHYNARKSTGAPCECGVHYDHSFAWDNLGFDGPKTYRDLGYDVPLANVHNNGTNDHGESVQVQEGYYVGTARSFSIPSVSWQQTPTKAKVVLNATSNNNDATITAVLNGNSAHAVTKQPPANTYNPAMSFDFPTSDAIQGTNTIAFTSNDGSLILSNVSLIMVAGAPVPGGGTNPTPPPPPPNPPPGDTTPPTVSFNFTGFSTQPVDNAVVTDKRTVSMTISSSDASGISSTTATINGSATTISNNSITTPNANGNYTISVTVKDNANNTTTKTQTILIRHRDFSRNGVVDLLDLSQLLKAWNTSSTIYDFNNTTTTKLVDLFDLSFLMQQYGSSQ